MTRAILPSSLNSRSTPCALEARAITRCGLSAGRDASRSPIAMRMDDSSPSTLIRSASNRCRDTAPLLGGRVALARLTPALAYPMCLNGGGAELRIEFGVSTGEFSEQDDMDFLLL